MEILGLDAHERGQPIVNLTSIQPCFPKCTAAWHCRPSLDDANRDYLDHEALIFGPIIQQETSCQNHTFIVAVKVVMTTHYLLPSWEFVRFNLAILARVYFRNINDWDVGRFHQPQVAAHLFCAAGNTVKLDIDRSDDDDDDERVCLNLSVHQESHLERSSF